METDYHLFIRFVSTPDCAAAFNSWKRKQAPAFTFPPPNTIGSGIIWPEGQPRTNSNNFGVDGSVDDMDLRELKRRTHDHYGPKPPTFFKRGGESAGSGEIA